MKIPCATLLLACSVFIAGCMTQSQQPSIVEADQNYALKPDDTISVRLSGFCNGEPLIYNPRIDDQAAVTVQLVGPVQIAGLSTIQATAKIYPGYVPKHHWQLEVEATKVEFPNGL